ncbi:MAG: peptidylprolyl isomerase [Sphingomonadales bacterium]
MNFRAALCAMLAPLAVGAAPPPKALAPSEIVSAAPAKDWVTIAASDLLIMDLVPDRDGNKRRVIIQLMPPPFSQGWIGNIRKLAAAHWWDGTSINRVQDNYVAQWGDADAEDKMKAKKLPDGLVTVPESGYTLPADLISVRWPQDSGLFWRGPSFSDTYTGWNGTGFEQGWPIAAKIITPSKKRTSIPEAARWPVHCYGMVGVGRDLSPNTGSGAELYTVIGHAPRHLDRNIALVGRVISGIENLSSLPRGTGPLGFYEKPEQRVGITSIRLASELPAAEQPKYQYLSTESASFARYADARANRRDAFFIVPAGGADICNVPVPVRKVP